jgi:DNA polymerase elongation subunit (family B)
MKKVCAGLVRPSDGYERLDELSEAELFVWQIDVCPFLSRGRQEYTKEQCSVKEFYEQSKPVTNWFNQSGDEEPEDTAGKVLLWCSSQQGHSVCVVVQKWKPFFWLELSGRQPVSSDVKEHIRLALARAIPSIEHSLEFDWKRRAYGFVPDPETLEARYYNMVKISCSQREFRSLVDSIKCLLKKPLYTTTESGESQEQWSIQESHEWDTALITMENKFSQSTGIYGSRWITVKDYSHLKEFYSHAQYELSVDWSHLKAVSIDRRPPVVSCTFDIETYCHRQTEIDHLVSLADEILLEISTIRPITSTSINDGDMGHSVDSVNSRLAWYTSLTPGFPSMLPLKNDESAFDSILKENSTRVEQWRQALLKRKESMFPQTRDPRDAIINIGCLIAVDRKPVKQVCFCLDHTVLPPQIVDELNKANETEELRCFNNEYAMLVAWWRFIVLDCDPLFLLHFNGHLYDLPVVFERLCMLSPDGCNDVVFRMSPYFHLKSPVHAESLSSKQSGSHQFFSFAPRFSLDMMQYARGQYKAPSYRLNDVCRYLKIPLEKIDLSPLEISRNFKGSPEQRGLTAHYCLRDCLLPLLIFWSRFQVLENLIEISRVSYTMITHLLSKGSSKKSFELYFHGSHSEGYICNQPPYMPVADGKWQGGCVLDAQSNLYPYAVILDFSSLYPSIMVSHNLCTSTLVLGSALELLTKRSAIHDFNTELDIAASGAKFVRFQTSATHQWVFSRTHKGIVPTIASNLLVERKRVKRMADRIKKIHEGGQQYWSQETISAELVQQYGFDPVMIKDVDGWLLARYQTYDLRQLAFKIVANSLYGFWGMSVGRLPCFPISETTTCVGRSMINFTKQMTETDAEFRRYALRVVYGDTDSVFVISDDPALVTADYFDVGLKLTQKITRAFQQRLPGTIVNLEMEKVYSPLLLMDKKQYVGLKFMNQKQPQQSSGIDVKGMKLKRTDVSMFTRDILSDITSSLLVPWKDRATFDQSLAEAQHRLLCRLEDALRGQVPLSKFELTKSLSKEEYASDKVLQRVVADKVARRTPEKAYQLGDRVSMIYCYQGQSDKIQVSDKVEDFTYALENQLPPDLTHYITNELALPACKMLYYLMPDPMSLFNEAIQLSQMLLSGQMMMVNGRMIKVDRTTINLRPQASRELNKISKQKRIVTKKTPPKDDSHHVDISQYFTQPPTNIMGEKKPASKKPVAKKPKTAAMSQNESLAKWLVNK